MCFKITQGGVMDMKYPTVICQYIKYMGVIYLADMQKLHCYATVMWLNRWCLKLFFIYLVSELKMLYYSTDYQWKINPWTLLTLSSGVWLVLLVIRSRLYPDHPSKSSISWSASVARNYTFGLIWRSYGPKWDILDYWGTNIFCIWSYYILLKDKVL